MAGGIAHDFNNLLAVVLGNAGFLRMTLPEDDATQEVAAEIEQAGEQGAELISHLLSFARGRELEPRVVDLRDATSEFLKMGRAVVGNAVVIETDIAPTSGPSSSTRAT